MIGVVSVLHWARWLSVVEGLSCALQNVEQHPWPIPTKQPPAPRYDNQKCLQASPKAPKVAKPPHLRNTGLGERKAFPLLCRKAAGLANIFCKEPCSKYFWLSGPYDLCGNSSFLSLWLKIIHKQYVNTRAWLFPIKLYLQKQTGLGWMWHSGHTLLTPAPEKHPVPASRFQPNHTRWGDQGHSSCLRTPGY